MTFRIYDRVKETSVTTGTGSIVLNGAFGAFQSFRDAFLDGQTTYYTIENNSRWEVGQGVFDQSSNSISRDIVFDSSNNNSKIDLEGVSVVFCTLPASKAFIKDPNDQVIVADLVALSEVNVSGLTTNEIFNSGDYNAIGDITLGGDITVSGNAFVAGGLEIGNILANNIVSSGEIISSGFLTMIRNGEGNFFHAYKDDGIKQTVSLHVDSAVSPLWKLGLKPNPSDQTSPPTFAYVFGRDGQIGLLSNNQNFFSLGDSYGFSVTNESHVIFSASSDTGAAFDGLYPSETVLRVQGSLLQAENLQDWEDSTSNVLSVVDSGGRFGILTSSPDYDIDVDGSGRLESVYLTSGIYFQDGTFQSSASTGGGTGDAVEVSGWADVTMTNRDNAVSGYFQTYVDSQDHSAVAVSGWADSTMSERDSAVSGWADSTMSERDSAVSGWADTSLVNLSGWANTTIINGDNAVSGWADQTFDLQGVTDRGNNTTNSIFTGGDFFASGDITATSGQLSGINFTPLVEVDHPGYLEGRVFYDAENHCVTVYNDESEISLQVGQEAYIRVRNTTGSTITNGSPVYITGAQGQHITVDLATATEEVKSEAVGVATHDIENNSFGYVTTFGLVRGIDTNAFTEGDELFVSIVDGELTNTSPVAPNYKTSVCHVVVAGNNGSILVTPRDHKLGGGDAKTLGNIAQSGIAFFESITNEGDAGILASDPNFYFDQPNSRVQLDTGGLRFDDGTTQTTAASSPVGDASGIAFFDENGSLSDDPRFIVNSGTSSNELFIGINSDGAPDRTLTVGCNTAFANAGLKLVNYAIGNTLQEIVATSGGRSAGIKFSNGSNDWWTGPLQNSLGGLGARHVIASYELDNTKSMVYNSNGFVVIGGTDAGARLHVNSYSSSTVNTIFQATASQTANLTEWQDSADVILASVKPDGSITTSGDATVSGVIYTDYIRNEFGNDITIGGQASNWIKINGSVLGQNTPRIYSRGNNFSITAGGDFGDGKLLLDGVGGAHLRYDGSTKLAATNSGVYIYEALQDQDQSPGTSGQHLISTASGIKWASTTSSVTGTPSGVTFFGDDSSLTSQVNEFVYNSGTNQLLIGHDDWDKTKGAYADADLITASGTIRATGLTINTGARSFKFNGNAFSMLGTSETSVTTYTNIIVGGLCIGSTYTNVVVGAINQSTYDAKFRIFGDDPTEPTSMVTAATLQTANMQEWQTNDETVVAYVSSDGSIASSGTVSASGTIFTYDKIGIGTDSPAEALEISNGDIRMTTDRSIEWGGGNNRIRGNSGGVGGGQLRFYVGSYNSMTILGDGSTNWLPPGASFYKARVNSQGDFTNNGDIAANFQCEMFGSGAYVSGTYANAFGYFATAKGTNSPIAMGYGSTAEGTAAVALGYNAIRSSEGNYKVGIGANAGYQALSFERSTAVGGLFCAYKASGSLDSFFGSYAGYQCSGNYNIGLGHSALREAVGSNNIEISNKSSASVSEIGTQSERLDIGGVIRGRTDINRIGINISDHSPEGTLSVVSSSSSDPAVTVQGATLQSAPLQEWKDSAEIPAARVQPSGMYDVVMAASGTDEFRVRFGEDSKEFTADAYVTGVWLDFEDGTEYYDSNNGMIFGTWYNASKTARSYTQISRQNFRVEIGNGLRLITNATSTRINGDLYPYSLSTPKQCGTPTSPWATGNFMDLSVSGILKASGDPGSAGQILTSAGSSASVYWSTPTATNRTYNNITTDFSMSDDSDVVFMDTTLGSVNLYLPTAVGQGGKEIMVKLKAGSDSGVIQASGLETIDGNSLIPVYNTYENISLISDNANWFIS
jgi:hypothetical protein